MPLKKVLFLLLCLTVGSGMTAKGAETPQGPLSVVLPTTGTLPGQALPGCTLAVPLQEGGPDAVGRVQLLFANLTQDVQVQLQSSDPARLTVPALVTIPAGSREVSFATTFPDDDAVVRTQAITVTATAPGCEPGSATAQVQDNDQGQLQLTLPPVWQDTGQAATRGSVTLQGNYPAAVPATFTVRMLGPVTWPANNPVALAGASLLQRDQTQNLRVNFGYASSGTPWPAQRVEVTAWAPGAAPAKAEVWVMPGRTSLWWAQYGQPELMEGVGATLGLSAEGVPGVRTVTFESSDPARIKPPPPMKTRSDVVSYVTIKAVDDRLANGSKPVTITARYGTINWATIEVLVKDNDLHHLEVKPDLAPGQPMVMNASQPVQVLPRTIDGAVIEGFKGVTTLRAFDDLRTLGTWRVNYLNERTLVKIASAARNVRLEAVCSTVKSVSEPFDVVALGPVDHFTLAKLPAKAALNSLLPFTLTARDAGDHVVTDYAGDAVVEPWMGPWPLPGAVRVESFTQGVASGTIPMLTSGKIVLVTRSVTNTISSEVTVTTLGLPTLAMTSIREGGPEGVATLTLPAKTSQAQVFTLKMDPPGQVVMPATLTVVAGQKSASVRYQATDNGVTEGTQVLRCGAIAVGYDEARSEFEVWDAQTPAAPLHLTLSDNLFEGSEHGGLVSVDEALEIDRVIHLTASSPRIEVPATVTLGRGMKTVPFTANVRAEDSLTGDLAATVNATGDGLLPATKAVTILDQQAELRLSPSGSARITEGKPFQIEIRQGYSTPTATTLTLEVLNDSSVVLPTSVTMQGFQYSVLVQGSVTDDHVAERQREVIVRVSGPNYRSTSMALILVDDDPDHFEIESPLSMVRNLEEAFKVVPIDADGKPQDNFNGPVAWSVENTDGPVAFSAPRPIRTVVANPVTVTQAATGVRLIVKDSFGHQGATTPFEVKPFGLINHFDWQGAPASGSSVWVNDPIAVTITARDYANNVVESYGDKAQLTAQVPSFSNSVPGRKLRMSPAETTAFTAGVWSGEVRIEEQANTAYLTARPGNAVGYFSGYTSGFQVRALGILSGSYPTQIREGPTLLNSTFEIIGTRSDAGQSSTVVTVTSSDPTLLEPASRTVPLNSSANGNWRTGVDLVLHDNPEYNGKRTVRFTLTAPHFVTGTSDVEVLDDDGGTLGLELADAVVLRDAYYDAFVLLSAPVAEPIQVQLAVSDMYDLMLNYPTMTIPAGATRVPFRYWVSPRYGAVTDTLPEITVTGPTPWIAGKVKVPVQSGPRAMAVQMSQNGPFPWRAEAMHNGAYQAKMRLYSKPVGDVTVNLTSSAPDVLPVPSSVVIPGNSYEGAVAFPLNVTTAAHTGRHQVTITATADGYPDARTVVDIAGVTDGLTITFAPITAPAYVGGSLTTAYLPTSPTFGTFSAHSQLVAVNLTPQYELELDGVRTPLPISVASGAAAPGQGIQLVVPLTTAAEQARIRVQIGSVVGYSGAFRILPHDVIAALRWADGAIVGQAIHAKLMAVDRLSNVTTAWSPSVRIGAYDRATGQDVVVTPAMIALEHGSWEGDFQFDSALIDAVLWAEAPGLQRVEVMPLSTPSQGTLSLRLPVPAIKENAGHVTATLSLKPAPAQDVTVKVASSLPLSAVPETETVTIRAGQPSVLFNVNLINTSERDGTRSPRLRATAPGFLAAVADLDVVDDESPILTVTTPATMVEGQPDLKGTLTLERAAPVAFGVQVTSSMPEVLQVPMYAIFAKGSKTASFAMKVIDNATIDPERRVLIRAGALEWGCLNSVTTVIDNERAELTLTLPAQTTEAAGTITGTVTLPAVVSGDLEVSIECPRDDVLRPPATVVVPKGASSVTFAIAVLNDSLSELGQQVTIAASAPRFRSSLKTVLVKDDDACRFEVELPPAIAQNATVTARVTGWTFANEVATDCNATLIIAADANLGMSAPQVVACAAGRASFQTAFSGLTAGAMMTVEDERGLRWPSTTFRVDRPRFTVAMPPQVVRNAVTEVVVRVLSIDQQPSTGWSGIVDIVAGTPAGMISPRTIALNNGVGTAAVVLTQDASAAKLSVTDSSGGTWSSNAFTVGIGSAVQLVASRATVTPKAGVPFTVSFTARDAGGNAVLPFHDNVVILARTPMIVQESISDGAASTAPLSSRYRWSRGQYLYYSSRGPNWALFPVVPEVKVIVEGLELKVTSAPAALSGLGYGVRLKNSNKTMWDSTNALWDASVWTGLTFTGLSTDGWTTYSGRLLCTGTSVMLDVGRNNGNTNSDVSLLSVGALNGGMFARTNYDPGDVFSWAGSYPGATFTNLIPAVRWHVHAEMPVQVLSESLVDGVWTATVTLPRYLPQMIEMTFATSNLQTTMPAMQMTP